MIEKQIYRLIQVSKKLLGNEVKTVVEIGARDCSETLVLQKNFPNSKVFTFECNPNTLPQCRNKVSGISNITLVESAVSETDGQITFNQIDETKTVTTRTDGNPGASSIFKASGNYPPEQYVQKEITVPSTRLDTFLRKNGLEGIDILWMDIQGAELMALRSLGEYIKNLKVIHLEMEFFEIYKDQPLFKDINKFLVDNGFNLIEFTSAGKYAADGIYVRTEIKKNYTPIVFLKYWRRIKNKITSS